MRVFPGEGVSLLWAAEFDAVNCATFCAFCSQRNLHRLTREPTVDDDGYANLPIETGKESREIDGLLFVFAVAVFRIHEKRSSRPLTGGGPHRWWPLPARNCPRFLWAGRGEHTACAKVDRRD